MPPLLPRASSLALAALIYASLGTGCVRQPPDDPRRPVAEAYANLVLATYEDTLATAKSLDQAIDGLIAQPSEQTLAAAREKWRAARAPYSYAEAFRFYAGPIDGEGGPEGELNGWPLDENHIDAVRIDGYNAAPGRNIIGDAKHFPGIDTELIKAQNEDGGEKNIASGYHAIEFLLWGQDGNVPPDSAGQRPYTDYVVIGGTAVGEGSTDPAARRGKYLQAASALLIQDLETLVAAWRKPAAGEPANYRVNFVTGDVYTALKRMFTGMAALAEVEMAGERMNVPLLSSDQEEEQSCFSDNSGDDLRSNIAGIEHVYYGKYPRLDGSVVSGPNLAELVKAADPRVAEEMDARITRTRETLAAIRNPFDREILAENTEGRARVQAGIEALRAEATSFTRAAKAMKIFLSPIESSGD